MPSQAGTSSKKRPPVGVEHEVAELRSRLRTLEAERDRWVARVQELEVRVRRILEIAEGRK
jgi:hypothetical protein